MEAVCELCMSRYSKKHPAQTACDDCRARLMDIASDAGMKPARITASINRLAALQKAYGWDEMGAHIQTRPGPKPKVEKAPKIAVTGDVLATYLGIIQEWRAAETEGKERHARIDEQARADHAEVDKAIQKVKTRLDTFTKTNAVKLEPILQAMAQPLIEAKNIEKQREADKVAAEQAAARRAEIAKEMRESA